MYKKTLDIDNSVYDHWRFYSHLCLRVFLSFLGVVRLFIKVKVIRRQIMQHKTLFSSEKIKVQMILTASAILDI